MPSDYNVNIISLANGEAVVVDCRTARGVTVRTGTAATAVASAVDSGPSDKGLIASVTPAATTGVENVLSIAANLQKELFANLGPHPFFRVQVTGGPARVSVV